uniref:Uncharacterized protein n=1 Tax=Anguilla anguilla TaxID=7936 RepID=A0A0E9V9N1_ANGAN
MEEKRKKKKKEICASPHFSTGTRRTESGVK